MKPPIFILGSHKSGTSLLRSLFDGHDNLFVFPKETHFFQYTNYWVDYGIRRNYPNVSFSLKNSFFEYFKEHNENNDPFSDLNTFNSYDTELFFRYFDKKYSDNPKDLLIHYWKSLYFSITKKCDFCDYIFVEKSVENAEFASLLMHFFPKCKFIHIVRNPYATISAIIKSKSKDGYPFLGKIIQSLYNSYYYLFKNTYLDNYMVIKYEDLLTDPERYMKELCSFLNLPFSQQLLVPTYSGKLWEGNSTTGTSFRGISQTPIDRWKNFINPIEIKIVNTLFDHVLSRYEYDRIPDNSKWLLPCRHESLKKYIQNRLFYRWYK